MGLTDAAVARVGFVSSPGHKQPLEPSELLFKGLNECFGQLLLLWSRLM